MTTPVIRPDGRRIAYAEYGPADGTPVLLIPGAGCGRLMTFGHTAALDDRGIRLISVDRPGLGASTPHPSKTLDSVAADLAAVIDAVVGHPIPVVANSQGAPFGLAVATTGRASRLLMVSPIDDVGYPPITAMLPDSHRSMVADVLADPDAAQRKLSTYTADTLFDMVMNNHPASDDLVYEQSEFRTMLRAVLADGFASGGAGYARDTVLATSAWPLRLFGPGVRTTLLFGKDDHAHSPDLGATLTNRIRGSRRIVIDGVGGSLLWARPDVVFDEVQG
ncbi:alpha/beta fold hydrolase [Mycolicibacterium lutetiense]